ncbi:MAG: nucleotidyltransferase domain-containing protein [Methanosarcinales archaeon]
MKKARKALEDLDDVVIAYVFGSVIKNKMHAFSDIDIAVKLKDASFANIAQVNSILVDALGDKVHTVLINGAPPLLRYEVVKHGALILSRSERERILFESRAIMEGLDEKDMLEWIRKMNLRRIIS